MTTLLRFSFVILFLGFQSIYAQNMADFTSVTPTTQTGQFIIPSSHSFQRIIKVGDPLSAGGNMLPKPDFTGYVPIASSSTNGYLSINSEDAPVAIGGTGGGGVTVLDINLNGTSNLWETTASQTLNFAAVGNTAANCSGTVTPWGTVISCEEFAYNALIGLIDFNFDGYNDVGWNVEINPATKTVIGKHWAMGNMAHENVTIHSNERTVYQGADSNPGYLYKFVATNAQDLSAGNLYVFSGSKNGAGAWVQIANSSITERNTTIDLSAAAGGTVFNGIEDVEIGPDGMVYFAVKNEGQVYRFSDSDPLEASASTVTMETYVGNMSYDINDGSSTTSVPWGNGNDNLAFDGQGNLWVLQDGGNSYIWVVKNGHTQASPDVEIFGIVPNGSEPTGITFTPDYKYLFMSILLLNDPVSNNANQIDAAGATVNFNTGTSLVIALSENLGTPLSVQNNKQSHEFRVYPNPLKSSRKLTISGQTLNNVKIYSILGKKLFDNNYTGIKTAELNLKDLKSGIYLIQINDKQTSRLILE
ncbi:alkaline phosphatase PhoX [Flavobacteriaceae bacterium SZ-1-7]|uniref:alkaline phosphatase PhoX n=1 Tax=Tamlana sedimenti TaxID=3134126 RepID=UPI00312A3B8B